MHKGIITFIAILFYPLAAVADEIQTNIYTECYPTPCPSPVTTGGTASVSVQAGTATFDFQQNLSGYDWRIYNVLFKVNDVLNSAVFSVTSNDTSLSLIYGTTITDQYQYHVSFNIPLGTPIPRSSVELLPKDFSFSIGNLPNDATASDFFISNPLFEQEGLTAEFELVLLADNAGTTEGTSIASSTIAPPFVSSAVPEPESALLLVVGLLLMSILTQWRPRCITQSLNQQA